MDFLRRWLNTALFVLAIYPVLSFATDAQFQGPSSVVYFVGTQYDVNNGAVFIFGWEDATTVSPITTSGALPAGVSFQTLALPLPNDQADIAIIGTPAAGSEGTYELTLSATVDGTQYSFPIKLVVDDQSKIPTTISSGFTGNWYGGRSQSGNGFALEVLPNSILVAEWFVFAPGGGQAWIVGSGPITGNSATVSGFQTNGPGGLFPPQYDNSHVQTTAWGSLTFTFYDCNDGQVTWTPTAAGYEPGSMPLQRLTMPAGLTCP
jgi:hypothetical protein